MKNHILLLAFVVGSILTLGTITVQSYSELSEKELLREQKFESGFYDKIQDKISLKENRESNGSSVSDDIKYHYVVFLVDRMPKNNLDSHSIIQINKNNLEKILQDNYGATEIYKGKILSFVSAKIPIDEISKIADHDYVSLIGDGEIELKPLSFDDMDESKNFVNVPNLLNGGKNIKIGIIDTGLPGNHDDLPTDNDPVPKIIKQVDCVSTPPCSFELDPDDIKNHTTRVAGITSGLGLNPNEDMRGVAPDAELLIARALTTLNYDVALDWMLLQGANIVIVPQSSPDANQCDPFNVISTTTDEAIDRGLFVTAGIESANGYAKPPACAHNVLSVGAVDDLNQIHVDSGKGPSKDGRIKPELVAPGVDITSTDMTGGYSADSGTSFATPFVGGAAAILIENRTEFTPIETRSAILLGANWPSQISSSIINSSQTNFTANDYDNGNDETFNSWGFGILNVSKSLDYLTAGNFVYRDTQLSINDSPKYTFSADKDEIVKVILSWLHTPGGTVINPSNVTLSNLDLEIMSPSGTITYTSNSSTQNIEFVIFNATETGVYNVTVSASSLVTQEKEQTFAISSTESLTLGSSNNKPTFNNISNQLYTSNGTSIEITLNAVDTDNDQLTFYVVDKPKFGYLSTIYPTSDDSSKVWYTPDPEYIGMDHFTFKAFDGKDSSDNQRTLNIAVRDPTNTVSRTFIEDFEINSDDYIVLLDSTDIGTLDNILVSARLPCDLSTNSTLLNVTAKTITNSTTNVFSSNNFVATSDSPYSCIFKNTVNSTDVVEILLENQGNSLIEVIDSIFVNIQ